MELFVQRFGESLLKEYQSTEPNLQISAEESNSAPVMNNYDKLRLLNLLYAMPHGVIEMSREIAGLVETSTNLASIKPLEEGMLEIATSQRSSVESGKEYVATMVESVFLLGGCTFRHSDGYPGWAPNPASPILGVASSVYEELFGKKPIVRAIHAGLECGLFLEKYPTLDMISFGPTLRGVHSPDERLDIPSTKKFWDLLLGILKAAPRV